MKFLAATFLILLTCLPAPAAPPGFAIVRVTDIYRDLPSTAALQEEVKAERDAIMQNSRAEQLRNTISELQALYERLQDKENPPDEETSRQLARDYEIKRQETRTLQQEFETFRAGETRRINRKMVESMRASLIRIHETASRLAKEEGFDGLFDSSGNTNTGIPVILHSKNTPDLTDKVKAALADSEPATSSP